MLGQRPLERACHVWNMFYVMLKGSVEPQGNITTTWETEIATSEREYSRAEQFNNKRIGMCSFDMSLGVTACTVKKKKKKSPQNSQKQPSQFHTNNTKPQCQLLLGDLTTRLI